MEIKQVMSTIESIRKRPGMYISDVAFTGQKNMLAYLFTDILYTNPFNTEVDFYFNKNSTIVIESKDINTSFFKDTLERLDSNEQIVSYGLTFIIALSEHTKVEILNNNTLLKLNSTKGNFHLSKTTLISDINYLRIEYQIDQTIFSETELNYDLFNELLRKYAYLNPTCTINSYDCITQFWQTNRFGYPKGLSNLLDLKIIQQPYGKSFFRLDLTTKIDDYEYQVCLSYQDVWLSKSEIVTYANYDELIYGGSLEKGIIDGVFLAVKRIASKKQIKVERKRIREQLILFAVIKGDTLEYRGPTKAELSMPNVKKKIKEFVAKETMTYLTENKKVEERIISKFRKEE